MNEQLVSIFRDVFEDPHLAVNDDLSKSGYGKWDSLEQVKLVIAIEEEFGVQLSTDEASTISSVAGFKDALAKRGCR